MKLPDIGKFTSSGVKPDAIPYAEEIKSKTGSTLVLVRNAPFSPEQFWRVDPVLEVAINMGLLDQEDAKELIVIFSEGNSEEFCTNLYTQTPDGNGVLYIIGDEAAAETGS